MFVVCDIETMGLDATYNLLTPITRVGIRTEDMDTAVSYMWSDARQVLNRLIAEGYAFVFHNAAFDLAALRLRGFNIQYFHDTMAMSYCLNPSPMQNHSLAACAAKVGGMKTHYDFESDVVDEEALSEYNINDVNITWDVYNDLFDKITHNQKLKDFYQSVELPYINCIIDMFHNGIRVDKLKLESMLSDISVLRDKSVSSIQSYVGYLRGAVVLYKNQVLVTTRPKITTVGYCKRNGQTSYDHCKLEPFNPNSSTQIEVAFAKLGLTEFSETTATGKPSFTKDTLELIPHPLAPMLVENKMYESTLRFIPPLLEGLDSENRLRTSFKQFNTTTGRLSSTNPNLQNIPTNKTEGYNLRECFIARDGYSLVVGDLNRIELVVLAYYLQLVLGFTDMADAVRAGVDLHQYNADVWGCARRVAKTAIFCLIYGGGADKVAHVTGVSVKEARTIIKNIYAATPVRELKDELLTFARKSHGVFYDVCGRLLRVEGIIYDKESQEYARASRQCFNYLIQGSAGSVFKVLQNNAKEEHPQLRQVLQVHDEVIYEVELELADYHCNLLTQLYNNDTILSTDEFFVPITAEFHHAKNWSLAKC